MPGPPPKQDDKRQRTNSRAVVSLPHTSDVVGKIHPVAPKGLSDANVPAWIGFWESPLSSAVDPVTDLPALTRLFRIYDDIDRIKPLFDGAELTAGSTGQLQLHPYAKLLEGWRTEARQLEDRFGLNPKSRLQLGVTLADAVRKANENAQLKPKWDDDDSDDAAAESVAG